MDETKARLLEAAGREFAEKGYAAARVRSICARAGVNLAAINYHFGDKERLYLQALVEAHRCGAELPPEDDRQGATPAEQLRGYIHHFLSHILALHRSGDWQQDLMLREMLRPTRASDALVEEVIRPKFERLLRILDRIGPEADPRRRHAVAFSIIGQCLFYKMGRPIAERLVGAESYESLDLEFLTDHITAFSLAALGLSPPRGEAGNGRAACPGSR